MFLSKYKFQKEASKPSISPLPNDLLKLLELPIYFIFHCNFENFPLLTELWTFEKIFDLILVHPLYVDWDW